MINLHIESILNHLDEQPEIIQEKLRELHPADIADLLEHLPSREELHRIIPLIDPKSLSEVFAELEPNFRDDLINEIDNELIVSIISDVDSDDAVDILNEVEDTEKRQTILKNLSDEDRKIITDLSIHEEDTAGGIMAKEVFAVPANLTITQCLELIRKEKERIDDLFNIYVINPFMQLIGVISLMDLVTSDPDKKLGEIMKTEFISVQSHTDQEEVARIARKYDLVSIPVTDLQGRLQGRITIDDIVDVMEEEQAEDISRMTGTSDEESYEQSSLKISFLRLPWLITALVGELIAVLVISKSLAQIEQLLALSAFIPIITAMGGNVGMQSAAIVVRGLATGEILMKHTLRRLFKEIRVSILNGFLLSTALMLFILPVYRDLTLCIVVGLGLFTVIFLTTTSGALFPILMKKLNLDPAIAAGPFITTTNDILGLLIYFAIARIFI